MANSLDGAKAGVPGGVEAAEQGEQNFFVFWEPIVRVVGLIAAFEAKGMRAPASADMSAS